MISARTTRRLLGLIGIVSFPWAIHAAPGIASIPTTIDHDDDYMYRLPYGDEADYPVLQSYGSHFTHTGVEYYTIDFAMPEGTPVLAAREGVVVRVDVSHSTGCLRPACAQLANVVVIQHSDGTLGRYFHLQEGGALVEEGQDVARGQVIALSGNTGYTNTPHLHFGVYAPDLTGRPRSIEVRFATSMGLVARLRVGRRYRNVEASRFAQR
jgi:murein DD-endopeptidase MepM/ murein hydrolase activator NlpD